MNSTALKIHTRFPSLHRLIFFDVESSGLHKGSFPIQFGWTGIDLTSHQFLVRPHKKWSTRQTDPVSFDMHGISRQETNEKGISLDRSCFRLNTALMGADVISDNPKYDQYWTDQLFQTASIKREFKIHGLGAVVRRTPSMQDKWCWSRYAEIYEAVKYWYPHTHKADEDSLSAAAMFRGLIDREWAMWVLDRKRSDFL